MSETLAVEDLQFEIRRSDRRKTLEIIIDRGGELVLATPGHARQKALEDFVRSKRFWIYTKLARSEALRRPVSEKDFVSGEGFYYLGRNYRLLLVKQQRIPVKLEQGRFRMSHDAVGRGRGHMINWYTEHASRWLTRRVERFARRIAVQPTALSVRDLGYRWGSCGQAGRLYFHWKCILLPPAIADYVVVHELVHLGIPHHTADFWRAVARVLPDLEQRKAWLAERGSEFVI
jgi:predicted metal-dependent hydrolase